MVIYAHARIRYYGADGALEFESPPRGAHDGGGAAPPRTEWMAPEGPHSVENIDAVPYHAIRVEVKGA